MARTATGRLITGVLFDIRSAPCIPGQRLNACRASFPTWLVAWPPFAFHRFVLDPVGSLCGGRTFVEPV
jgi:hypothetical protein